MNVDFTKTKTGWNVHEKMTLLEYTQHVASSQANCWKHIGNVPDDFTTFTPMKDQARSSLNRAPSEKWDLSAGMDGTKEMMKTGWKDAPSTSHLKQVVSDAAGIAGEDLTVKHAVAGPMLDLGAYCAGLPECCMTFEPAPAQPVIKIGFDAASNWNVPASHMALRGAVVHTIAEWLKPYASVEVVAFMAIRYRNTRHVVEVQICDETSPLDSDGLAFFASHPAAFRRTWFAYQESHPNKFRDLIGIGDNYGTAESLNDPENEPEVYLNNQCPKTVTEAIAAVHLLAKSIRREFFHES
tara:strand:- start:148 stop:1038 length:891 start_codon:yes stop_codon:yes gene_type:complete